MCVPALEVGELSAGRFGHAGEHGHIVAGSDVAADVRVRQELRVQVLEHGGRAEVEGLSHLLRTFELFACVPEGVRAGCGEEDSGVRTSQLC